MDPQYAALLAHAIVDTVRDPLLVLDCQLNVKTASRSFLREFQVEPEAVDGHPVYDILDGSLNVVGLVALLEKALADHTASKAVEIEKDFPRIGKRCLVVEVSEVFFAHNVHKAILVLFHDVTERRSIEREKQELLIETQNLLKEKHVLLLEMQHRISNSLQIIANILMIKTRATTSEEARKHLQDAYTRVMSVAEMQRHIDGAARAKTVSLPPYFKTICDSLVCSMVDDNRRVSLRYEFDDACAASTVAVSLGLIVTELVINSLKYAFPTNRPDAEIVVKYETSGDNWRLTVADNGVGRPGETPASSDGLGSTLVKALAQQVKAQIETKSDAHGLTVSLTHVTFTPRDD
ncbi:PAS domain-containing protein (plasmid) [Methylocystis sp. MJC1]|uniref:sensor histidine kinase n=1 Tax=Methylocystis sp. MJC1 TaxID=2654282 RepID=UPI0020A6A15C|nr:histidine kinase dimerization/phosphoacceptor domain -containing protein [Methylocystis sp. MJC1]KAF2988986.1 putative sensor histidine kinase pdtaS [Methylocystis sp. MJC1]UZX13927.1 PAS domain-containing protein [Methylocystis sp. MJC1]